MYCRRLSCNEKPNVEIKMKSDLKSENTSPTTPTLSVKLSSVPVVFSQDLLYMPFTCWLPGEAEDDDVFLLEWENYQKMNGVYKLVLLSAAKRSEKDLVLPKRNSGRKTRKNRDKEQLSISFGG